MRRAAKKDGAHTDGVIAPEFMPVIEAFAGDRQVSRKRMFSSSSVLSVGGKIFAMHARGKFVAKLPRERVDDLVAGGAGEYFDPGHGRLMKEWVAIAGHDVPWIALAREAHAFVKQGGSAKAGKSPASRAMTRKHRR
jgi:hypothetical protein